jgi:CofD-related protein of GAK system
MKRVRVTRTLQLPDALRVERCLRAPALGPALLFFSGGTALRDLARHLKHYTHNSVHVITPFDSGGSSASLRQAFDMPSVGDLRNRLLALADDSLHGNPEVQRLMAHRLAASDGPLELASMLRGEHQLVEAVPAPMRRIIRTHLRHFAERMPAGFELAGASVGNLVLAGGYLNHEGDLDSVLYLFSKLVEARGLVLPVVESSLHLTASLEDGSSVTGQHHLTGKEVPPIASPVVELHLCRRLDDPVPVGAAASSPVLDHLSRAELIVYPMGSFYTSVLANLLPSGVGRAVRQAGCPKVYVPNVGHDPEQHGLSVAGCVEKLLAVLQRDAGPDTPTRQLLDYVLLDSRACAYPGGVDADRLADLGVETLDVPLADLQTPPLLDPERLSQVLLSLA